MGPGRIQQRVAALAQAVLGGTGNPGALTVATSHLGALKRIADEIPAVVNASLQFDSEQMQPSYRLVKGRPGRSFGIQIAKRLKLPESVVGRALALLDDTELRADRLLARLERDEKRTRELLDTMEAERAEAAALLEDVSGREADLRVRERTADKRARQEARQLLLQARAEVERALADAKHAAGDADAERAARRALEGAAARVAATSDEPAQQGTHEGDAVGVDLEVGQRVRMKNGATGVVAELGSGRVFLELDGGARLQVAADQLALVEGEVPAPKRGRTRWQAPASAAPHEVDLRGLRVEQVQGPLATAIDQAVLSDLPSLRIIHGMGTGAVRAKVSSLVQEDPRIDGVRAGERGEGGAGVTVVTFR